MDVKEKVREITKQMMVEQGYVPEQCTLDGNLIWMIINKSEDPCAGCNEGRSVCGGRPPKQNEPAKAVTQDVPVIHATYNSDTRVVTIKRDR